MARPVQASRTIDEAIRGGAAKAGDTVRSARMIAAQPPRRPEKLRLASVGRMKLSDTELAALERQRAAERLRKEVRRRMHNEHDARMTAVLSKIKPTQLNIMAAAR